VRVAGTSVVALTPPQPRTPDERPPLAAARPEVWLCRPGGPEVRNATRDLLRDLLATYLRCKPEHVPLSLETGEAPSVAATWRGLPLFISLSYGAGVGAVALCPGAPVGIDLAEVIPMPDWERVATLYLGMEVEQHFATLDGSVRELAFATEWSAMEARSKCLGIGLEEWSTAHARRLTSPSIRTASVTVPSDADGRMFVLTVAVLTPPPAAGNGTD